MALITTGEYKVHAGIADTDWDARVALYIGVVQGMLEDYCGRAFEAVSYSDAKFSGNGEQSIWIHNTPIITVEEVKTVDSSGFETTLAATAYRFTERGELFRLDGSFDSWDSERSYYGQSGSRCAIWDDSAPDNILVSYQGGYSTIPHSLKGLMYILVDAALDDAGENWKLSTTADGVVNRAVLAPDLITRRYADLCRPWRGSGLAVG